MSELKSISNYDIIGYKVVSPFHLVALLAYAQRQFSGKTPKILVVISKGPWVEGILSHRSLNLDGFDLDFCNLEDLPDTKGLKVSVFLFLKPFFTLVSRIFRFKTIDVCATSLASLKLSSSSVFALLRIRPIIIDEGIGSYNIKRNIRREVAESPLPIFLKPIINRLYLFFYDSIKLFGGSRQHLFDTKGEQLLIKEDVARSYKNIFVSLYSHRGQLSTVSADILLVTQPLAELGIMSESAYEGLVRNIELYATSRGLSILVKPHPAENVEKYEKWGMRVVREPGAIEGMIATGAVNAREVWGFNSTSLITLPALFGLASKYIVSSSCDLNKSLSDSESMRLFKRYSSPLRV